MDEKTEKLLRGFSGALQKELGENLRALILYGSGARGDFIPGRSDVNLLVVVREADCGALFGIGKLVRKYRSKGFATPAVADLEYWENSLDVFPIEFAEIQRHHRLVFGEDLITGLKISRDHLRLQLEREFKQNLLWLRELLIEHPDFSRGFYPGLLNAGRSLYTHLQALSLLSPEVDLGLEPVARVEKVSGTTLPGLRWLLRQRQGGNKPKKSELRKMLPGLMEEVNGLARWIDRAGKRKQ